MNRGQTVKGKRGKKSKCVDITGSVPLIENIPKVASNAFEYSKLVTVAYFEA